MSAEFDQAAHDRRVAAAYERLFKYDLFDNIIDKALDGEVELQDAIATYEGGVVVDSPAESQSGNA